MLKKMGLVASILLYMSSTGQAAMIPSDVSDPGADLKRSADVGDYYKQEQKLRQEQIPSDKETVINKTEQESDKKIEESVRFAVKEISVSSSDILTNEEIKAITIKYEGQELGLEDLYQAVTEINGLYKNKKYLAAKAVLPPQKIENGVAKIQLVEGRFGQFIVEDNKQTNSSYITERISLHSSDLIKLDQLQKDIFYFNNTNDVKLRAELKPGSQPGTTDCILRVKEEPDQWQTIMYSDNAGRKESGRYRLGMVIANNSLFGNRESLVISPVWTRGIWAGGISYSLPVNKQGTRLGLSYNQNQVNIISGPYESLDIVGNSSDLGFSISHPFTVEEKRKIDGFAEVHWKDSSTDFSSETLLDSKVTTLTMGANIRSTDSQGMWYNQYSITGMSADKRDAYSSKNFYRVNLSTVRLQDLGNNRSIVWRLSGQYTNNKELPSSEQFSLGGMSSVKGYEEGLLSGDQGYYTGVEYNFPLSDNKKVKGLLFADAGATYNAYNIGTRGTDHLTSAGLGVILNYSPDLFGKIIVGFPIDSSKEHDSARIHFFLQSKIR